MVLRTRPGTGSTLRSALAALAVCGGSGIGCAHVRPAEQGFLSDYSAMVPTDNALHSRAGVEYVRVRPASAGALAGVDSFYIAPLAWRVEPSREVAEDPQLKERVISAFDRGLRDRLAAIRPVVDRPGPNTAEVRAAITDIEPAWPLANVAATIVATPVFNGGGAFEAEVLAPDRRQIAAVTSASTGGALEFLSYFSRSRQPSDASRRAVDEIASAVASGLPGPVPTLPPLPGG